MKIGGGGKSVDIEESCNTRGTGSANESWIGLDTNSENRDGELKVNVERNNTEYERDAVLTFTYANKVLKIAIKQAVEQLTDLDEDEI